MIEAASLSLSRQEYKMRFWCEERVFQLGAIFTVLIVGIWVLLRSLDRNPWGFWSGIGGIIGAGFLASLLYYGCMRRILITGDQLIMKDLDRIRSTKWADIRRIEEVWSWSSRSFYVRTPQGIINIPDTIERCEELLQIIQERSGKRIVSEWRGAKDSLREEWHAFLRWIRSHPWTVLTILLLIAAVSTAAVRWAIGEYRTYHPTQLQRTR